MKILIAEDEPILQIINQELLEDWGYHCDIAANGAEAIEYAIKNKGKYQLCIMDIEMPVMNGIDATKIIRERLPYFPILAFTSCENYRSACIDAGMDDFLVKSCSPKTLLEKIKRLVQKSKKTD